MLETVQARVRMILLVLTSLRQSGRHFVLCGVDVARSPAALSSQGHQGFNQNLGREGERHTGNEFDLLESTAHLIY